MSCSYKPSNRVNRYFLKVGMGFMVYGLNKRFERLDG